MEVILSLLEERNTLETAPFTNIITSNVSLNNSVYDLQLRVDLLQMKNATQQQEINKLSSELNSKGPTKIELKQMEKIQKLEEQVLDKINIESQLSKQKETNKELDGTILALNKHLTKKDLKISQLDEQLTEAQSQTKLAEKQYDGLKETIRRLQEDNDTCKKQYEEIEGRIMTEKEKSVDLMNKMNGENEELKKKIEMLTQLNQQEKKRFLWSAKGHHHNIKNKKGGVENVNLDDEESKQSNRKFGTSGVVVPSKILQRISAHQRQATSLRYDTVQGECIATASEDCTVRLWNTGNGQLLKSFRAGSSNVILGLDYSGSLVAACGTDKMCRIWNTRTERLVHQLIGHSQKVTSARFTSDEKSILTSSADRSLKVWDITRNTYRQTVTMRHSSSSNCIDVSYDSITAASGHLDGGVRFWDIRSSERTAEITDLHSNGVTSVHFNPKNNAEVLTTGRDSIVKLIDVRKSGQVLQSFFHSDFQIDLSYAGCTLSPDGKYAGAGSSTGDVFIWRTVDGQLETQLKGHQSGVVSVAWDRGGINGQQFASVDKQGVLMLWA